MPPNIPRETPAFLSDFVGVFDILIQHTGTAATLAVNSDIPFSKIIRELLNGSSGPCAKQQYPPKSQTLLEARYKMEQKFVSVFLHKTILNLRSKQRISKNPRGPCQLILTIAPLIDTRACAIICATACVFYRERAICRNI